MNNAATIGHLSAYLEKWAPSKLSASWDNTGLLVGLTTDEVKKVLLSLDLTTKVVDYAIQIGADTIITHHPYFLAPLLKINDPLLIKLIRHKIALISLHTNLDFISGGVNNALAKLLGLSKTQFLSEHPELAVYHIAVYTPQKDVDKVSEAVFNAGAGVIGNYSRCLNQYQVKGQFMPLPGSNPTIGSQNTIEEIDEVKIEFYADETILQQVLQALKSAHSYETPAYSVYRLHQSSLNYGLGLVGSFSEPCTLRDLALFTKKQLQAPFVKLWLADKTPDTLVQKVAVCGGSGSDLISLAARKADVYISADFTYHKVISSPIPLIDGGHFFTENPIMPHIKEYLSPLNLDIELFDEKEADIHRYISL